MLMRRLAAAMKRPELAHSSEYGTMTARLRRRDAVNGIVSDWTASQTVEEVLEVCEAHEVPCSLIYSIADIFEDPHYKARENLLRVTDPRVGEVVVPAPVPRLSETPARFRHTGPALGADNDEVYASVLGLDAQAIADLRQARVI